MAFSDIDTKVAEKQNDTKITKIISKFKIFTYVSTKNLRKFSKTIFYRNSKKKNFVLGRDYRQAQGTLRRLHGGHVQEKFRNFRVLSEMRGQILYYNPKK